MKSLDEYNDSISAHELFVFLYDQIITRSITHFGKLMEYVQVLPKTNITELVFRKAFRLIKELNWGVFAPLTPLDYPDLWQQLVLPVRDMPETGDLKRNTSISTVYTAILDIHGYSAFCQKNRRNLSMLQLLDECIQNDIRGITLKYGTLSWRTAGDTIILVSAKAFQIASSALGIIDYFSRRRIIKSDKLVENRSGNKVILPDMAVSAGITGGRAYNPLVITQDGDISGDLVNAAARLQDFANILDPEKSKILVSNNVAHQLQKYARKDKDSSLKDIEYFNLGPFQFKGMDMTVSEVLFKDSQKNKLIYQKSLTQLYSAISAGKWRDSIFSDVISSISKAVGSLPPGKLDESKRDSIQNKCNNAVTLYKSGNNYKKSINILEELFGRIKLINSLDPIIIMRTEQVLEKYNLILCRFESHLEDNFQQVLNRFLDINQRDLFLKSKKSKEVHDKLKSKVMDEMQKENKKYSWFRIIDEEKSLVDCKLYIGKK